MGYKSDTPFSKVAYYNLALSIRQSCVSTSEAVKPLDENNRYLESARLYRIAIHKGMGTACANLVSLINLGLISTDENNNPISESQKLLVMIRLYEKAIDLGYDGARANLAQMQMLLNASSDASDLERIRCDALEGKTSALIAFSLLIADKKINLDENNNKFDEENRYKNAARLLQTAIKKGGDEAANNLATLIVEGHICVDENNLPFNPADRFIIAARLFRQAINTKHVPCAYHGLASLIHHHGISHDENNNLIQPDQKYHAAAAMLIKSIKAGNIPSRNNLGMLIMEGHINYDENKKPFKERDRYEIAARLFRESLRSGRIEASANLGHLIRDGKISRDEKDVFFEQEKRYLTAARLYAMDTSPMSQTFLLALYLRHPHTMQKTTNEEKMALLIETIKQSQEIVRIVSWNAAYNLYGKRQNAITLMPDTLSFTKFEWGLYEYLLDIQDEQSTTSDDRDVVPLSTSDDEVPESVAVERRPLLTMAEFIDNERLKRSNIDENFKASLSRLSLKSEKAKAKIDRLCQTAKRLQDVGTDTTAAAEPARNYTFTQKAQEDLTTLGFFKPSDRDTRSDVMYSLDEINKLESAKKAGRGLHKMVDAINTGEQRAGAETLRYERLLDGKPLCTMEFNKKDRLVYTIASDGHITIWGAQGHDDTINQMRRRGLLK